MPSPASSKPSKRIDFGCVARTAQSNLPDILRRWLPDGRRHGNEWVALNPRRDDSCLGSFKVNLRTGQWADFATGDKGGDVISLVAYLRGLTQTEAAQLLARELKVRS